MGLRLAGRSNGVAQLHGAVSREMFQGLWPDVTGRRGADRRDHQRRARAHVGQRRHRPTCCPAASDGVWDGADEASWAGVAHVAARPRCGPPARTGRADAGRRSSARSLGEALLDPNALTIGFARRFATYKRATLLLSQPDRLRASAARRRPAGAVRVRRQGPPRRSAGQGHDPRHRDVRPRPRRRPPLRVRAGLRHGRRAA